jgi:hypothetical protein
VNADHYGNLFTTGPAEFIRYNNKKGINESASGDTAGMTTESMERNKHC